MARHTNRTNLRIKDNTTSHDVLTLLLCYFYEVAVLKYSGGEGLGQPYFSSFNDGEMYLSLSPLNSFFKCSPTLHKRRVCIVGIVVM